MAKIEMKCHCGAIYYARTADLKRGWGYSCSKRCAAIRRDFGRKRAKPTQQKPVKQTKSPPSTHRLNDRRSRKNDDLFDYEEHPFSLEAFYDPMTGTYHDGGGNE